MATAELSTLHSNSEHPQEVPKEEESILNYLLEVRSNLSKLKQNRTKYLNSREVQGIYQKVLTKVRELDDIRKNSNIATPAHSAFTLIHNAELHNRVDSVLDEVFQLLSLCFLTVGLKNSAPATYASLSTVQKLLEHLDESNVFTNHDLRPIKERLDEISAIVESTTSSCGKDELTDDDLGVNAAEREEMKNKLEEDLLLRAKLKHCLDEYYHIHSKLEEIHPDLKSLMEKLYIIRRSLLSLAAIPHRRTYGTGASSDAVAAVSHAVTSDDTSSVEEEHKAKLDELSQELAEIESHRDASGRFKSLETDKVEEKGQMVLNGLLDNCHDLVNDLSNQSTEGIELDQKLQPIYEELLDIKTNLANLMVTRRWTLRETDLFQYQKRLAEIDNSRVDGRFPTTSGSTKGQSIILYLLRRCYAIIYKLLESSEPVSESLQPIHNQLSTARRCLLELKRMGGVNDERELYPYQLKLASLDELRVDGKFYDSNGEVPEGQGTLNALLYECFDMMHELEVEAEERINAEQKGNEAGDEEEQPVARSLEVEDNYDAEEDVDGGDGYDNDSYSDVESRTTKND